MAHNWDLSVFEALYESIVARDGALIDGLVKLLAYDLKDVNATYPRKNDASRTKLETGKITTSDGGEYEVNKDFVVALVQLSDDLNLDELISAELILYSSNHNNMGASLVDSAKANFYLRRQNILSIVSYILNAHDDATHVDLIASVENTFKSFQSVQDELTEVKNMIKRSHLLGSYNSIHFQQNIKFRRDFLYKEHELLGEVLLGLVTRHKFSTANFLSFYHNLEKFDADDLFMIHFLPALFKYCSQIDDLSLSDVKSLFSSLVQKELSDADKISNHPIKLLVILVFITYFTQWCSNDKSRSKEYEFETSCSTPMASCIELGAFEQLMCIAADTTKYDVDSTVSHPYYDFRSLLQKHLPKLFPKQILDIDEQATHLMKRKLQQSGQLSTIDDESVPPIYLRSTEFQISNHFISIFIPLFANFVESFITSSAFMLTKLRDSEEDTLLSSETFDLDQLSIKADLERFYLTIFYIYSSRPSLASRFWEKSSPLFGFIKWASSSNSALMRSTFCVMLSAFASGERNAIDTYNFLQSNTSMGTTSSTFVIQNTTANINWSSIYEDLMYYSKALTEPRNDNNYQQSQMFSSLAIKAQSLTAPQLGEDSILFITGYFQVISQVAYNNEQTKKELFESDGMELPKVLESFLSSNTPLTGACLLTLRSLVGDKPETRRAVFNIVENWIFKNNSVRQYIGNHGSKLNVKKIFANSLTKLEDILGFINLFHDLFLPVTSTEIFKQHSLQFPLGLGLETGRKQGIYPYFEFLLCEVFASSTQSFLSHEEKSEIQKPLLSMILNVLNSISDKSLTEYSQECHLKNIDNLFQSPLNYKLYIQSEPSSLLMNFLFDDKVFPLLFDIISTGIDELAEKPSNSTVVQNVSLALSILDRILSLQQYFIDTALPIIKDAGNPNCLPSNLGPHGMRSFYDAILFNLPVLAHLLLYIGSHHVDIANQSLEILHKLVTSSKFNENTDKHGAKNIIMTTFETIDESERIKNAFIDQLSSEVVSDGSLTAKLKILKFLDRNLSNTGAEATVAHFLLGFELKSHTNLTAGDLDTDRSLFGTLLYILISSIDSLGNGENIYYAPMKLGAAVLEIILKLCRSPLTAYLVLPRLRNNPDFNLFTKLLSSNVNLDCSSTSFEDQNFDAVLSSRNVFTTQSPAVGALISFTHYRKFASQYLLIELNSINKTGPLSLRNNYMRMLLNGNEVLDGSPKILGFLDILEFNFLKIVEPFEMKLFNEFNYDYILQHIKLKDYDIIDSDQPIYDISVLRKMIELKVIEFKATNGASISNDAVFKEALDVEKYLINYSAYTDFQTPQLNALKSWTFLIQFIVIHGQLEPALKSRIILEVFQLVLPKINDYVSLDILFAQELVSLCVLLYDQYDADKNDMSLQGLLPIFQTSIHGLCSSLSVPELRSDLYVLANKYLIQISESKERVTELLNSLDISHNDSLFKTMFDDSILGESSARVTSLIFLGTLIKLSAQYDKLAMTSLMKNDYLSLLVRSVKRTDDLLLSCSKPEKNLPNVSLYSLLYELTALKATLYFLIRVSQTRLGASKLVQSDIFSVFENCQLLKIDPDLGVNLKFDELNHKNEKLVVTNLSLDTPLRLPPEFHSDEKSKTTSISLFEIFVPMFQLVNAIIISMGPSNKPIITKTKSLLSKVEKLVIGLLKRDAILEEKASVVNKESNNVYHNDVSLVGLQELVKQLTLMYGFLDEN